MALCIVMACFTSPALAVKTHPFLGSFDNGGAPFIFTEKGVAVDQATGDIYVIDDGTYAGTTYGAGAVYKFDAAGNPKDFSGLGTNKLTHNFTFTPGSPSYTGQIAIDRSGGPTDGDIYVAFGNFVDIFAHSGAFLGHLTGTHFSGVKGVAVDRFGHVFLSTTQFNQNPGNGITRYTPSTNPATDSNYDSGFFIPMGSEDPRNLALDSTGGIYVSLQLDITSVVDKYNAAGVLQYTVDSINARSSAVAVDPENDHVFVAENPQRAADTPRIAEFDASGPSSATLINRFGDGLSAEAGGRIGVTGVAVDGKSGKVYVSEGSYYNPAQNRIDVFGPLLTLPTTATGAPSGQQETSATVHGTVNPDGVAVTDCHFEYGADSSYGQSTPCAQSPASLGSGSSEIAVSAGLSGLLPSTTYHYRLVASNAQGKESGADQTLRTPPGAPLVDDTSASDITKTAATLNAQVNPYGFDTTYHFEYGADASYGSQAPVSEGALGSGIGDKAASQQITGLQPNTTYHFRVSATNAEGTTEGPDQTFTTQPILKIDSTFASDITKTTATLNAQVNPLGDDTTYHFEYGADTSYGSQAPVSDADLGAASVDQLASQSIDGLSPDTTYHFRIVASNGLGAVAGPDQIFTTLPILKIDSQTVSSIGKDTATICAQINPLGDDATYHFQYGTTPAYGKTIPPSDVDLGSGGSAKKVCQSPTGLALETTYHFRIVATNALGSLSGPDQTFTTHPVASIGSTSVTEVSNSSATLNAQINVWNDDTTYHFEYGADASYGSQAPVSDADLGAASVDQLASIQLGGLSAETTFHYRVVAQNAFGVVASPDRTFTTQGAGGSLVLPDHRVWEMVSPVDKNGGDVAAPGGISGGPVVQAALDGDSFTYGSTAAFGDDAQGTPNGSQYIARRGSNGWSNEDITTPMNSQTYPFVNSGTPYKAFSLDLSKALEISGLPGAENPIPPGSDALSGGYYNFYIRDNLTGRFQAVLTNSNTTTNAPPCCFNMQLVGTTPDLSYVLIATCSVLTTEPGAVETCPSVDTRNFYLWSAADGELHLNGQLPSQEPPPPSDITVFTSTESLTDYDNAGKEEVYRHDADSGGLTCLSCNPTGARPIGPSRLPGGHAVSPDGNRVLFESSDALVPQDSNGKQDIYEWESEGTGSCQSPVGCLGLISSGISKRDSFFLDADPSGDNAFFVTDASLSPQDPGSADLYDARVDGGFPPPPTAPTACEGDACQSPVAAPDDPTPSSSAFQGAGNQRPFHRGHRNRHKKSHLNRHRRTGHNHGGAR